ncbi:MAG: DUF2321 domain-containing protein [Desulfobacteraceae bacterium]|nr:DUF2321 domain-containing protein [Desulfobacteraceae bacterium]
MGYYDIQQVCLNGHQITDSYNRSPELRKKYCNKCGAETVHECPECNHPIKGDHYVEDVLVIGHLTPVPSHCENCGKPYPWEKPKKSVTESFEFPVDKDSLNPWPVILSFLQELPSDDVCRIIGLSGLQIDWTLTKEQAYSHTTRKRAYLPRIQSAYKKMPEEKKLIIAWLVASELSKHDNELIEKLNLQLEKIGWKIVHNGLIPIEVRVGEVFFPKGTTHDAYVEIKNILQKAKSSLDIIDPYVDNTIFQMIATIPCSNLEVRILSFNLPPDLSLEAKKFISQHPNVSIEVRTTKEFHDRFIIIDGSSFYHIGASIKDAGNKAFMINEVEDKDNKTALLQQQKNSWTKATEIQI